MFKIVVPAYATDDKMMLNNMPEALMLVPKGLLQSRVQGECAEMQKQLELVKTGLLIKKTHIL